jgi:hypothetical protein
LCYNREKIVVELLFMTTGEKLRNLLSDSQLAALDAVRQRLVEDPEALDHRREVGFVESEEEEV